jgi:hypothetical protein
MFCFLTFLSQAQEADEMLSFERSGVGLSASLQNNQLGILVPVWVGKKASIVPSIRFASASDLGSDLGIGLGVRLYFSEKRFSPYVVPGFAVLLAIPSGDSTAESTTDFTTGINFGGEYFLSRNFSFAVEAGIAWAISADGSERFGNPGGTVLNTAAAVVANVYF